MSQHDGAVQHAARNEAAVELHAGASACAEALALAPDARAAACDAVRSLVDTLTLVERHAAVSKLGTEQWQLLAMAAMRAASRRRLPALRAALTPGGGEDGAAAERLASALCASGYGMHQLLALEDVLVGDG